MKTRFGHTAHVAARQWEGTRGCRLLSVVVGALFMTAAFGAISLKAQDALTLREAISIALENGDRAAIARKKVEEQDALSSPGVAGLLPSVDLSGGIDGSYVSTRQEFVNGEVSESSGALSTRYNAGAEASWTVFDGFGSWRELDRLHVQTQLSRTDLEETRRDVALSVADSWFQILLLQQQISAIRDAIALSIARRDRARDRVETGSAVAFELTQAQVDLDRDSASLLESEILRTNAEIRLNRLLNRDPLDSFSVSETEPTPLPEMNREQLLVRLKSNNSAIRRQQLNVNRTRIQKQIVSSEFWPKVDVSVGYDFTRSESDAGFVLSNRTSGLNAALTGSWNIFDGFSTSDRERSAEIAVSIAEMELAQTVADLKSRFEVLYRQYEEQGRLVSFSQQRLKAAEENLQLAKDRVELGAITPIEIREAQNGIIDAETALIEARYRRVRLGLRLMALTGDIDAIGGRE